MKNDAAIALINDMKQESFDYYIKKRDRKDKLKRINDAQKG